MGALPDEFKAALGTCNGSAKANEAVTIGAEDDSICRSDIIEAVNRVDSGDGVAILTDMFGGTPSNLAISCMSRPKVEVLAGINLPMLVKLAKVDDAVRFPAPSAMASGSGRSSRPCQLDQHGKIDPCEHFHFGPAHAGDREVGGRAAEHVGKNGDAVAAVDAVDGFNDVASTQIRVVLGSDRDSFDLLLRTHYMFKRRLELVGKAPMGHKVLDQSSETPRGCFLVHRTNTRHFDHPEPPRQEGIYGIFPEFNRLGRACTGLFGSRLCAHMVTNSLQTNRQKVGLKSNSRLSSGRRQPMGAPHNPRPREYAVFLHQKCAL